MGASVRLGIVPTSIKYCISSGREKAGYTDGDGDGDTAAAGANDAWGCSQQRTHRPASALS